MITLRYCGYAGRYSRLKEGMYVTVPTNWATDSVGGCVTKDAIPEIMEELEKKRITVDDYDSVFYTMKVDRWQLAGPPLRPGYKACKVLLNWRKV